MKQLQNFAVKWIDKFRDQNINYIELVDHHIADDCVALGFEMDCGKAFEHFYGNAIYDHNELEKVIDSVTDISLLGSAIYSRWRYFNHWVNDTSEILEPENRTWFILALSRLLVLSGENSYVFQGTLKKIHIVSNNICYGPEPQSSDEVEQWLTINDEGCIWFSGYNYGDTENYDKARSRNFKIEKNATDKLFKAMSAYFGNEYEEIFATDIGTWVMELTNTEGVTYNFSGSLCADFDYRGIDLSDFIRETTGMDDLYVFDGNCKPDVINRIVFDYHRITKSKPKVVPEWATWEYVTWDYTERLLIDRETETLEHIQNIGTGCKVSRKYEIEGGIENLLDNFDADELFLHIEGNDGDIVENSRETKDYTITIDYKKNPQRVVTGTFDKKGLPSDFDEFAETVSDFIRFYGLGEILDPSLYGKVKGCKKDYIFCSVTFDDSQKSYYYLTDDDSIVIGDFVVVPVGKDNHETVVEVVGIEYFAEENVPLPIEKTKLIIRKYNSKYTYQGEYYC